MAACPIATARANDALDALVAAYPDHLAGHDATALIWKDGTRMPLGDEAVRSFEAMLKRPTIRDQFAIPYPLGKPARSPAERRTRPFPQRRLLRQDVRRLPQGRVSRG